MIHLDARRPGVVVPPQYANDAHLRLNLCYRYSIPDLDISDERVQATLSFGGRPFHCILPWRSVFGITSQGTGDGQVWPEDLPVEVVHSIHPSRASAKEAAPSPRQKPALSAVQGLKEERPQRESAGSEEPTSHPHLRLVR